jgi:hypothetical protein
MPGETALPYAGSIVVGRVAKLVVVEEPLQVPRLRMERMAHAF